MDGRAQLAALVELSKPRITKLVVITAGVGLALGAMRRTDWGLFEFAALALGCLVGTAFSSAGASTLNMWVERRRDARMPRTATRPLPERRLSAPAALVAGLLLSILGVLMLSVFCGPAPALVSLTTIVLYVLIYTPLKTVTTLNTVVGTIPGALPPLIGWTAAAGFVRPQAESGAWLEHNLGSLADLGGWSLVLYMVVWQVPHFLALAWMYKDDYAKGGYRMLPVNDADGLLTARQALIWSIALVPASLAPVLFIRDLLGPLYAAVAIVMGAIFIALCARFVRERSRQNAKRVFLASIAHLPLVFFAMLIDAALHTCMRLLG